MPFDVTDLLESAAAPHMYVEADDVLAGGRLRRLQRRRRRIFGAAVALGAAAFLVPVATAMRPDTPPALAPAASSPVDCLITGLGAGSRPGGAEGGAQMTGTPWLDTGSTAGDLEVRVQVNTDTCHGLAVAVSTGSGGQAAGSVVTEDTSGQPDGAFWVVDATGAGVDRFGKALPVTSTAVVLLPAGQQVCGVGAGPEAGAPQGQSPTLSESVTVPAGPGWWASFATMSSMGNSQGATLRICEGTTVVEPTLRPLNEIISLEPEPTGSAVTYFDQSEGGMTSR